MAYPKILEHTKNYLVNIQTFGTKLFGNPVSLNYLATSFDINYGGGAGFVHQKGRDIASSFAKQPSITASIKCYMTEPDFSIVLSQIMREQQQILLTVGRLDVQQTPFVIDNSAIVYEIVGYINNAKVSANAGEFIVVDFTINADDISELDPDELIAYNP